jgi:hypothetical protein
MKTFSKTRVGTMAKNSTMTRPKELGPKVIIVVRMKTYLEK